MTDHYQRRLQTFRHGPGVFKVDYALSGPIPRQASGCLRAATVHLGGTFEEIAASEKAVRNGQPPDRPFVLLAQPNLFDPSRSPGGKHTAWAYCHVPNGSKVDMLGRLEDQIERFAPGFRERVLARRMFSTADLESMDANLVGGDIGGGAMAWVSFCTGQLGGTTLPRQKTSISVPHRLRPGAACTACVATMPRKWRCRG